ncbi:hypothetical protein JJB98_10535 [Bradyrhizobium diazoefficiens]|nr:hypothetical protein [Bradyrhizobium diazoefficiens]QQO20316.1 hypothetical protein JJB98_10535 [Bradyrhizobium diazoefficiens]
MKRSNIFEIPPQMSWDEGRRCDRLRGPFDRADAAAAGCFRALEADLARFERDWELGQVALPRGMKTLRQIWPEVLDGDSADIVRF